MFVPGPVKYFDEIIVSGGVQRNQSIAVGALKHKVGKGLKTPDLVALHPLQLKVIEVILHVLFQKLDNFRTTAKSGGVANGNHG